MANPSGKYAIVGVGISRFGKLQGVSTMGFTLEASKRAIEDAGLARDAIDGVLVMMPAIMGEQHGWAARVAAYLGIEPTFSATMDMGGATACGSVQTADGGHRRRLLPHGPVLLRHPELAAGRRHAALRLRVPGAVRRRRRHHPDGAHQAPPAVRLRLRDEHYGHIAVTWRKHAQLNPDAQMRKPMTLDDYLGSRWVAEPLRLFDCCPNTDGGGACIVTSLERARDLAKPPARLLGAGQSHSSEIIHPIGRDAERTGAAPGPPIWRTAWPA